MEGEKVTEARRNEVGYCGNYCRPCHWYDGGLMKPAAQLLDLIRSHFEVAGWINYKGGSSKEMIKGLEILSRSTCTFNCKGGSGWSGCPVRNAAGKKAFSSVLNVLSFHAIEIGARKASIPTFLQQIN